jgi:hypothetical protein
MLRPLSIKLSLYFQVGLHSLHGRSKLSLVNPPLGVQDADHSAAAVGFHPAMPELPGEGDVGFDVLGGHVLGSRADGMV